MDKIAVVGIGASAGGVTALKQILPNLPKGSGFAYVVALHMDPTQRSLLVDILEKESAMPVSRVTAGAKILPENIYVVPPDHDCAVQDGKLRLLDLPERMAPRHSIDILFASLAEAYGECSAGIVMSGTGSDGTHGMLAIKQAGGIAIVQDPKTAEYKGMPQAVIDAGLADLTLAPAKIGLALEDTIRGPRSKIGLALEDTIDGPRSKSGLALEDTIRDPLSKSDAGSSPDKQRERNLDGLLTVLSDKSNCDFSQYKESTLIRRIDRRMAVHKLDSLKAYTALVKKSDVESELLFKDILISVTAFFRDEATFKALGQALRKILAHKPRGEAVRVWVAGCATGEEAYSIAILLNEALGRKAFSAQIQIFATDIDTGAIAFARRGFYLETSMRSVPSQLLKKYFIRTGGIYQVTKKIRDMVIFARHDLMQDPPYINLDLVSCRNVLIYFRRPMQDRLIPLFHYSLRPGGYLALGLSESIGQFTDWFTPFDQQGKVFVRTGETRNLPEILKSRHFAPTRPEPPQPRPQPKGALSLKDLYRDLVTEAYAPAGVLVNNRSEIVHVQGDVTRFIRLPPGDLNVNVMDMAIAPLRIEIRLALQKAQREQAVVRRRPVQLTDQRDSAQVTVSIIAIPATTEANQSPRTLLLFEEGPISEPAETARQPEADSDDSRIKELEQELTATREQLQTSIEDQQSSNENLQSVNEEYQSTAEELQSANEELQTTNEELQSSNEELRTVNDELKLKTDALESTNTDLENILNTVLSGIVVLDRDHQVTRYSAASKDVFDLLPTSIGKSLAAVGSPFDLTLLSSDIERVTKTGVGASRDLMLRGKTFAVRLIPLFENGATPAGTVITFSDESERKQAEQKVRRLAAVVEASDDAIAVIDLDGKIVTWNHGAEAMFGYTESEARDLTIGELVPKAQQARMAQLVQEIISGESLKSFELKRRTKDGQELDSWLTATLLRDVDGKPDAIAITERDLTEMKLLVTEKEIIRRADQDKSDFLARISHELRTPLNAILGFSEIIKDELFGPVAQRRYVEYGKDIHTSGKYLLALVNDILDLSKIEDRQTLLEETVFDLPELAEEITHLLRLEAEKQGILFSVNIATDLPKLRSDRRALQQILLNLLGNAIKFTPRGGRVSLEMRLNDDGNLNVTVSDTGIGIGKEDLPKIMAPFTQLNNHHGSEKAGYGLGLTISRSLAELLGSKLEIESKINQGTIVAMRFENEKLVR